MWLPPSPERRKYRDGPWDEVCMHDTWTDPPHRMPAAWLQCCTIAPSSFNVGSSSRRNPAGWATDINGPGVSVAATLTGPFDSSANGEAPNNVVELCGGPWRWIQRQMPLLASKDALSGWRDSSRRVSAMDRIQVVPELSLLVTPTWELAPFNPWHSLRRARSQHALALDK